MALSIIYLNSNSLRILLYIFVIYCFFYLKFKKYSLCIIKEYFLSILNSTKNNSVGIHFRHIGVL